jgi:predicted amidohydrolase YtcJ
LVSDELAADIVLMNGKVVTVDDEDTIAEAVAIKHGRIIKVGDSGDVRALAGDHTEVIDLKGRTVLPGLTDAHVHMIQGGTRALDPRKLDCRDFYHPEIKSIDDIVERIGEHARRTPKGDWIIAIGSPMADFRFSEGRYPTRDDMDMATTDHPAFISFGAHITVVNSLGLQVAGITSDTPDPIAGIIVKDDSGEPTGLLRE